MGRQNTILIVSNDIEYVRSIECILATEIDYKYSVEIITDKEYLEKYLAVPHRIDVLVIEETMVRAFSDAQIVGNALIISDKESDGNIVNKLDGAAGILRKMGSSYLRATSQMGNITSKIIDVVSVSGGSGKTVTALGVAIQLTAMRKKVLYIDAENIQNFYECMGDKGSNKKYFDSTKANLLMGNGCCGTSELSDEIVKGRFDYLAPFKGSLIKYQVSSAALNRVARKIAEENVYDYIVVEHGRTYTAEMFDHLGGSEKMVISMVQSDFEVERVLSFMGDLRQFSGQVVAVVNRCTRDHRMGISIEYDQGMIPMCEQVGESDRSLTLDDIFAQGLYRKTAEAIM